MPKLQNQFLQIGYIDELAGLQSPVHNIESSAKLVTTLVFIVTVVSFDRYTVMQLLPFFIFPAVMISAGGLPAKFLLKSLLIASPFAVMVGVFNPMIDHSVITHLFGLKVTGGWVSFCSIILRFALTVTAALVLVSLTGFNQVCASLERFYVPRAFVVQLMFLYRYIFVLTEEAGRMVTARSLRSFGRGEGMRVYASLLGHLLLRALDRAQRIHLAMFSRGFDGNIRLIRKSAFGAKDAAFVLGWSALFIAFRIVNIPLLLGGIFTGIFS